MVSLVPRSATRRQLTVTAVVAAVAGHVLVLIVVDVEKRTFASFANRIRRRPGRHHHRRRLIIQVLRQKLIDHVVATASLIPRLLVGH